LPRKKPDAQVQAQTQTRARAQKQGAASASSAGSAVPALRLGIGGPVGAGKSTLVAGLCRALQGELSMAIVSNDTHALEDAELLEGEGVLESGRIAAVHAGCSPQAAIRDDIAANLEAVEALEAAFAPLDLVLIEGGGADLSAVFSRGLIDRQIFVIDAAAGGRTPRKGGAGITDTDLLLVNKTDLAPHVGADLEQMRVDAAARRSVAPGGAVRDTPLPTLFTSLAEHPHAPAVADWVRELIAEHRASVAT
jgi:urease accessory protein